MFAFNLFIAIPLIYIQDQSNDILGVEVLKQACADKRVVWPQYGIVRFVACILRYTVLWPVSWILRRRLGIEKRLARIAVFCLLLDQTDPLFSFLVYRKEGQKGISFRGFLMLTWHNALLTTWWVCIWGYLPPFFGWIVYKATFKFFTFYYS